MLSWRCHKPRRQNGRIKLFCIASNRSLRTLFRHAKGSKKFKWTDKYEQGFLALKKHLRCPPLLSKPIEGKNLYLYLTISEEVVCAALVREEEKVQWPVYYMGKRLLDVETRYLELEKLTLALMVVDKCMKMHFYCAKLINKLSFN